MQNQYLAVRGGAGTNTNDRYFAGSGNLGSQTAGYTLQQQHGGTGLFQCLCVCLELCSSSSFAALHAVTAKYVDRLGRQAQMDTGRDTALCQSGDGLAKPGAAFQLDHVGAGAHEGGALAIDFF